MTWRSVHAVTSTPLADADRRADAVGGRSKLGVTDTAYANPKPLDPRQMLIQIDIEPKNVSWTIPAEV
jgi:acetolactate synthase-1/2/3 large subunit